MVYGKHKFSIIDWLLSNQGWNIRWIRGRTPDPTRIAFYPGWPGHKVHYKSSCKQRRRLTSVRLFEAAQLSDSVIESIGHRSSRCGRVTKAISRRRICLVMLPGQLTTTATHHSGMGWICKTDNEQWRWSNTESHHNLKTYLTWRSETISSWANFHYAATNWSKESGQYHRSKLNNGPQMLESSDFCRVFPVHLLWYPFRPINVKRTQCAIYFLNTSEWKATCQTVLQPVKLQKPQYMSTLF